MTSRTSIALYRLPSIQLTAVPRENTVRAWHASVRHNPGANPMRGIGIACPVLYPESPVNSSEAVISGPSPQLHAPPHVASLGVQKMIPSGHPPIPNHDSALVSTHYGASTADQGCTRPSESLSRVPDQRLPPPISSRLSQPIT